MGDFDELDLDRNAARAWDLFQDKLTAYLTQMTDSDSVVIEQLTGSDPDDGSVPYVQFAGFGGSYLRGEVSGNKYLSAIHSLDPAAERLLLSQGWEAPEEQNFYVHVPTAESLRLAVMAVQALRDVFQVPHPAFLTTPGNAQDSERLGLVAAPAEPDVKPAIKSDEPLAILPTGPEHLRSLVDQALLPVFGTIPAKDDDGDIPVPYSSTLVFIRVEDDDPVVELFSFVVRDIDDVEAARVEVGILNRDRKFIKFLVHEDWVFAHIQIPSHPFVPSTLRSMLHFMSTSLDEIDDDLALRTGGRRALEPGDLQVDSSPDGADQGESASTPVVHASFGAALEAIVNLDDGGRGVLDPKTLWSLCGDNRQTLLESLRTARKMESGWRSARESAALDADREGVEECSLQLELWGRVHSALVLALRSQVDGFASAKTTGQELKSLYGAFWERFAAEAIERGWTSGAPPRRHWWSLPAGGGGNTWGVSFSKFGCRVEALPRQSGSRGQSAPLSAAGPQSRADTGTVRGRRTRL